MIKIGVLSDTHLSGLANRYLQQVESCFADCPVIFHAGDLVDLRVLHPFAGKQVHAVHGNMCSMAVRNVLPRKKRIEINGFIFGLIHNIGYSYDFEEQLIDEFPEADCIVYGHTHQPVCHRLGAYLLFNPGSFSAHTHPTYGILEVGDTIKGGIFEVSL